MSAGPIPDSSAAPRENVPAARATPLWRKALPYLGTVAIFALIFWRIPIRKVEQALSQVPILDFLAVFMPYSLFYCAIDSACLTWVVDASTRGCDTATSCRFARACTCWR